MEVTLCGASWYEQKYYFNPAFDKLPGAVKDELYCRRRSARGRTDLHAKGRKRQPLQTKARSLFRQDIRLNNN